MWRAKAGIKDDLSNFQTMGTMISTGFVGFDWKLSGFDWTAARIRLTSYFNQPPPHHAQLLRTPLTKL